jgi:hypothetical protein
MKVIAGTSPVKYAATRKSNGKKESLSGHLHHMVIAKIRKIRTAL